jgi:hypothetical protein
VLLMDFLIAISPIVVQPWAVIVGITLAVLIGILIGKARGASRKAMWGVLLAVLIGFFLGRISAIPRQAAGSTVLHGFPFRAVIEKAGPAEWHILEDVTFKPFPPLGRPPRISRRIVAQATIAENQVDDFTRRFQDASEAALVSLGGAMKGEVDFGQARGGFLDGGGVESRIDLPRRYYAVSGQHGVADIWLVARGVDVTIVIAFTE